MSLSMTEVFGKHVERLREARGLTRGELGARSGLDHEAISRLEKGESSASFETLRAVCAGLDLGLSELFKLFEEREEADEGSP